MKLAELKALEAAATPGPWGFVRRTHKCVIGPRGTGYILAAIERKALVYAGRDTGDAEADAALIAAARNALPALIACAKACEQVAVLAEYATTGPGKCKSDALTAEQATSLRLAISDIARAALARLNEVKP